MLRSRCQKFWKGQSRTFYLRHCNPDLILLINLRIYLMTILLQALAGLVQSFHIMSNFQNTTTQQKTLKKHKENAKTDTL